jgi:integrase
MQPITNDYTWGQAMSVRKKIVMTKGEPTTWWLADYTDGSGQRHQRRFRTKKEAAEHHDKTKTAIRAGQHVSLSADLTIAGAADKWLAKVAADDRERGTLKQYETHVRRHIVPRIGNQKLSKMSKAHVEAFRDGLIKGVGDQHQPLSRAMASKVMVSLKSILRANGVAHLGDHIRVEMSRRSKEKLEAGRDIPTPAEVTRLLKAATGRWKALLMTAALTGLRASELRGLRWTDVDLKSGEVHVRQRADQWNVIGPPKSDGSRRTVPIGPELVSELRKWKLACPISKLDLVFPTSVGTIEDYKNTYLGVGKVMLRAGVVDKDGNPKFGLHSFRHFFASWCINPKSAGGRELPVKVVQTLLGHSSIVMTLDIYGHLFPTGTDRQELALSEKLLLA